MICSSTKILEDFASGTTLKNQFHKVISYLKIKLLFAGMVCGIKTNGANFFVAAS